MPTATLVEIANSIHGVRRTTRNHSGCNTTKLKNTAPQ